MPRYKVKFAHMDDSLPDTELQAGWGEVEITTDVPVETDEQLKEICRTIGYEKGFSRVALTSIHELEEVDE